MNTTILRLGLTGLLCIPIACTAPETSDSTEDEDPGLPRLGEAQQAVNGFYIDSPIVGAGPGCPQPLAYTITPDGQTFTVYFSDMVLNHPPGSTFKKTNCTVGLKLHLPHGQQFSIATVDTRGFAHLPVGTYMEQRSKYYFAGSNPELRAHSRVNGFYNDDWTYTDNFGLASSLKSPCGGQGILNIDTALILNTAGNPYEDAYVDNTSIDGTFRMIFQANWDNC